MNDLQSQLISLLERLSLKAPERCAFRYGLFSVRLAGIGDAVIGNGKLVEFDSLRLGSLLMAVLEEAHAQGWEWRNGIPLDLDGPVWAILDKRHAVLARVEIPEEGGILEREVLLRLTCLVLACEGEA